MSESRVYGRNPVLELLRHSGRRADEIAVLAGAQGPLTEVVALARRAGVKVSFRTRDQLTAMAGSDDHQGVVARVAANPACIGFLPFRWKRDSYMVHPRSNDPSDNSTSAAFHLAS